MRKFFFLLLIVSGVLTVSCSRKKLSFSKTPTEAQELIFQMALKHKTGKPEKNIGNFYYPERLDKFFFRHTLENGESLYLIEKYYPLCKGKLDCYAFNYSDFDNGNWVESVVMAVEEERLANELLDLLENDMEVQPPIEELPDTEKLLSEEAAENTEAGASDSNEGESKSPEEIEGEANADETGETGDADANAQAGSETEASSPDVPAVEVLLTDSMNRLKSLEYGKEIFVPQSEIGKSVVIHSYGEKVVRNIYDSQFRITKKETWKIVSIEDSNLELEEEYFYEGKSDKASRRVVKSPEKELDIRYDSKGHATQNRTYIFFGEQKLLKSEMNWKYDEDGNLVKEQGVDNDYKDGVLVRQNAKEQMYVYDKKKVKKGGKGDDSDKDDIPPIYEYYEDGKLKIRTEHTAKNDYTTKIYFEDDFVLTTYYENNKKVKDVYTVGGLVKRVKTYE